MTTGTIVGEGISGTTSEYRTSKFNGTGGAGKRTGIGRSNKRGVFRVCNPGRDRNNRPETRSSDGPGHKEERSVRSNHNSAGSQDRNFETRQNHNSGRQVRDPGGTSHGAHRKKRTAVREGKEKNRAEGEMTKGTSALEQIRELVTAAGPRPMESR